MSQSHDLRDKFLSKISSSQPSLPTDLAHSNEVNEQYEEKLLSDIKTKIKFLKNFKSHDLPSQNAADPTDTQSRLIHLMNSLAKVSYFPERRDTIGVSLAISSLDKQISELKETLIHLEGKQRRNTAEFQELFDINSQFKLLLQELKDQQENPEEEEAGEDPSDKYKQTGLDQTQLLMRQLEMEKIRYRQLKRDLGVVEEEIQRLER
ncbi:hypothetical protein WICPIJ_003897 [Wickerhamomyces pijperi]|uniref:Uncharacterized protein n=1 Tax=Wickerhamomyces pijperi TaxID=599730 RepID=A0A9P8TNF1_WICPI|nr:hypothetical protein WICPIJ_003897 [Wickerhamomyces pijperi]